MDCLSVKNVEIKFHNQSNQLCIKQQTEGHMLREENVGLS